jgi:type III restriction enzyme
MSFQLESLHYQSQAVAAVVEVFAGTPRQTPDFWASHALFANQCKLDSATLALNLETVARKYLADASLLCKHVAEPRPFPLDICVDMETGTGKTLVYLQTIYALQKQYGWSKFIIVVPSVAIRAGILNSLQSFGSQLAEQYQRNAPFSHFEYDSAKLTRLKQFITNAEPQIMVMTLQSFSADDRVINRAGRDDAIDGKTWFEALAECHPVVVMDEPQEGMDTENAIQRLVSLNPLAKLRYSATHAVVKNRVYRLAPAQAYAQGLVKKIEVLSVTEKNDEATLKIELAEVQATDVSAPKAKLRLWIRNTKGEFAWKESRWLKRGDPLAKASNNISYADFTVERIYKKGLRNGIWTVLFTNGIELQLNQRAGDMAGLFRAQLGWLIQTHLEKKAKLLEKGIKCLSLVFIDKVDNYLATEAVTPPLIKTLFEEEYTRIVSAQTGRTPTLQEVAACQGSYFSRTKSGDYTDRVDSMATNAEIYRRILHDKEGLLRLDDPIEFIFSHSALGVGWDNPNIFNIATLNQSYSDSKKRQEIGRGLRICVNQDGQRVYDSADVSEGEETNLLTVIPNETYATFARQYQQQVEDDYGDLNAGAKLRENNKGQRKHNTIHRRDDLFNSAAFKSFWQRMARTTRYTVSFSEDDIVNEAAPKMAEIAMAAYQAEATLTRIKSLGDSPNDAAGQEYELQGVWQGSETQTLKARFAPLDLAEELSGGTSLSLRATHRLLFDALQDPVRAAHLLRNPQRFLQQATTIIKNAETEAMLRGLRYEADGGTLPLDILQASINTYKSVARTPNTGVYDQAMCDSDKELGFARDADRDPQLLCLLKLPDGYKIATPIGTTYTPDFGLVFKARQRSAMPGSRYGTSSAEDVPEDVPEDDDNSFVFVVEVKGTNDLDDRAALTEDERLKILCAEKHFKALGFETRRNGRALTLLPGQGAYSAPHASYDHFKTGLTLGNPST